MVKLTETQAVGLFDAVLIEHALTGDKESIRELARRYEAALETLDDQDAQLVAPRKKEGVE